MKNVPGKCSDVLARRWTLRIAQSKVTWSASLNARSLGLVTKSAVEMPSAQAVGWLRTFSGLSSFATCTHVAAILRAGSPSIALSR